MIMPTRSTKYCEIIKTDRATERTAENAKGNTNVETSRTNSGIEAGSAKVMLCVNCLAITADRNTVVVAKNATTNLTNCLSGEIDKTYFSRAYQSQIVATDSTTPIATPNNVKTTGDWVNTSVPPASAAKKKHVAYKAKATGDAANDFLTTQAKRVTFHRDSNRAPRSRLIALSAPA